MRDRPCPTCLRPVATEAHHDAYEDAFGTHITPDGWPDPEGSHLCWRDYGALCDPPNWWERVTPLLVDQIVRYKWDLDAAESEYIDAVYRDDKAAVSEWADRCEDAESLLRAALWTLRAAVEGT